MIIYRSALLIVVISGLLACSRPRPVNDDILQIDSTKNTLYIDQGQSSIVINNSGDSTKCYDIKDVRFSIAHIAPDGEWNNYIVRQTSSTITCDGQEGQKRTIVVQLNPVDRPNHNAYTIRHDADEIILEHDYYRTVFYGCCDAEPVHTVYDYQGNKLLEGNARILIGAIPNNSIKFFVGYTPIHDDTTKLGSINVAFDAHKKYKVDIMSSPLPPDMCSQYTPAIALVSANRYDTLDVYEDEYQLWEMENIESPDQIRNIAIEVQYQCEIYYPVEPIKIPISFGKPFGKDSSVQRIELVHLNKTEPPSE